MEIMTAIQRQIATVKNASNTGNNSSGAVVLRDGHLDDKAEKERSQNAILYRKIATALGAGVLTAFLTLYIGHSQVSPSADRLSGSIRSKSNKDAAHQEYELFPFLVDSKAVSSSLSSSSSSSSSATAVLSTPTLPAFPIIPRLENCQLDWKPANPPRTKKEEWRSLFWLPSFAGSGGSNPTRRGQLIVQLIEGLFLGEINEGTSKAYGKPVKDYHMSMKNALRRCVGVSETIGCLNNHPAVDVSPQTQTEVFRPEIIMPIRNPATAIPELFTNKHIAYHSGTKQGDVESWRVMRDQFLESTFISWMDIIRHWRGTNSANGDESSYYRTQLYVPFEDIVGSDPAKGAAIVEQLSNLLSGTEEGLSNSERGFFETTKSKNDYECLWYRIAKQEWEREQQIIGDYIPAYTDTQKNMMVQNLTAFAEEIEAGLQKEDGVHGVKDSALAPLLRRYAYQIEHYVVVEDETAASGQ